MVGHENYIKSWNRSEEYLQIINHLDDRFENHHQVGIRGGGLLFVLVRPVLFALLGSRLATFHPHLVHDVSFQLSKAEVHVASVLLVHLCN